MQTPITNAILQAQNTMLREHIGILNDTVRAMETVIARMRSGTEEIPFPLNSPDDGSPWNTPDEYEIDGDADGDTYGFGGSEWIDPTSGRDTWHG
jgi:hypothetical protein